MQKNLIAVIPQRQTAILKKWFWRKSNKFNFLYICSPQTFNVYKCHMSWTCGRTAVIMSAVARLRRQLNTEPWDNWSWCVSCSQMFGLQSSTRQARAMTRNMKTRRKRVKETTPHLQNDIIFVLCSDKNLLWPVSAQNADWRQPLRGPIRQKHHANYEGIEEFSDMNTAVWWAVVNNEINTLWPLLK